MARQGGSRVKINRQAVDQLDLAMADGAFEVAKEIVLAADVPDAAPYGEGLILRGGALGYVGGKQIAAWSKEGVRPRKPRGFRVAKSNGPQAIAGFSFPGRFLERGTSKMGAQPFLTPARDQVRPRVAQIMKRAVGEAI